MQTRSFADVSIADVADAAGLKRSAFYFYFTGKHEAVTELLTDIFDAEIVTIGEMISRSGDARQDIYDALDFDFRSWGHHATLFRAMLDARDGDLDARAIWDAWLGRYEDFVAGYIVENRAMAVPKARILAHALIAMNERILERHIRSGDGEAALLDLLNTAVHVWTMSIFGSETA